MIIQIVHVVEPAKNMYVENQLDWILIGAWTSFILFYMQNTASSLGYICCSFYKMRCNFSCVFIFGQIDFKHTVFFFFLFFCAFYESNGSNQILFVSLVELITCIWRGIIEFVMEDGEELSPTREVENQTSRILCKL